MILENIQIMKIGSVEKSVDKLVDLCSENKDGNEIIYNATSNKDRLTSSTVYIVLFRVAS